jgi:hypothetical protein
MFISYDSNYVVTGKGIVKFKININYIFINKYFLIFQLLIFYFYFLFIINIFIFKLIKEAKMVLLLSGIIKKDL